LREISQGLQSRAEARYPVHPEDLYAALLPHLAWIREIARAYRLRATARIATGRLDEAFEDVHATFLLAETLKSEPFLISQLVRFALHGAAHRALFEGLAEHAWTEDQLSQWQRMESAPDFKSGILAGLRMERTAGCLTIDQVAGNPNLLSRILGIDSVWPGIMPTGWWRHNQVTLVNYFTPVLELVSRLPPDVLPDAASGHPDALRYDAAPSPKNVIARMLAPALDRVFSVANKATMTRRMAIVACGLERHWLHHQRFPATLAEVTPTQLDPAMTRDLNGEPLKYAPLPGQGRTGGAVRGKPLSAGTSPGDWYQLYSVGSDGHDHGGNLSERDAAPEQDWPWPLPTVTGSQLF